MPDFWKNTMSNILGVVIAALILAFFGLIYEKASKYDDIVDELEIIKTDIDGSKEKFIEEIAILKIEIKELSERPVAPTVTKSKILDNKLEREDPWKERFDTQQIQLKEYFEERKELREAVK